MHRINMYLPEQLGNLICSITTIINGTFQHLMVTKHWVAIFQRLSCSSDANCTRAEPETNRTHCTDSGALVMQVAGGRVRTTVRNNPYANIDKEQRNGFHVLYNLRKSEALKPRYNDGLN